MYYLPFFLLEVNNDFTGLNFSVITRLKGSEKGKFLTEERQ